MWLLYKKNGKEKTLRNSYFSSSSPPGFDSKVFVVYSPGEGAMSFIWNRWKGSSGFTWYLVVEKSSVNLLQTDFATFVNAACFI